MPEATEISPALAPVIQNKFQSLLLASASRSELLLTSLQSYREKTQTSLPLSNARKPFSQHDEARHAHFYTKKVAGNSAALNNQH